MSQPDSLREEFESFRDRTDQRLRATERELREVRTLAEENDVELATAKANTRLIQALRETQLEQERTLEEHGELLRQHEQHLALLSASYVGLEGDVADLKSDVGTLTSDVGTLTSDVGTLTSDVATIKADVDDLTGNVAGILRILDERLPPRT